MKRIVGNNTEAMVKSASNSLINSIYGVSIIQNINNLYKKQSLFKINFYNKSRKDSIMSNIITKTINSDRLLLVDYENGYEIFTPEQLVKDPELINNPTPAENFENGRIVSVKEVRPLRDQKHEVDSLRIELEESLKILDVLISKLFKMDNTSREYTEFIMRITNYLEENFVKKIQDKADIIGKLYDVDSCTEKNTDSNSQE